MIWMNIGKIQWILRVKKEILRWLILCLIRSKRIMLIKLNKKLLLAVKDNDLEKTAKLIEKGADISYEYHNGMSSLHFACFEGHLDMAELLIEKGAGR